VGFFDTFGDASQKFAEALASFPGTLSVQGNSRVEVVHNGAETFAKLLPAINEAVQEGVSRLSALFKSAFPEAGITVGG
jgi:hypothetical protein